MFDLPHTFRDPIHGFIAVSDAERRIINHPTMQRMRRIRQLVTSYFLYHGAEHSRFGHVLGVMEMATKVLDATRRKRPDLFGTDEEYSRTLQIARLAGLLHDIGHSPFSHASEELFPLKGSRRFTHEDYTGSLMLDSDLGSLLSEQFAPFDISPQAVLDVFVDPASLGKTGILLQDILAGELDADRMDYLSRDSLFAGVGYGRFDRDRLLDSITAVEDENGAIHLAVEEGGLQALEGFLLARYFMFTQVYLAPVRRFYDHALIRFLETVLPNKEYPGPDDLQAYLDWDDVHVLEEARKRAKDEMWASALWNRKHWKVVEEDGNVGSGAVRWGMAAQVVRSSFSNEDVIVDIARGKTQRNTPRPYITEGLEEEERPKILVLDKNRKAWEVEKRSELVATIASRNILITRIYARPEVYDAVKSSFEQSLKG